MPQYAVCSFINNVANDRKNMEEGKWHIVNIDKK